MSTALFAAADTNGWVTTGLTKSSCWPGNATVEYTSRGAAGRPYTECRAWLEKWIVAAQPVAVILSASPRHRLSGITNVKNSREWVAASQVALAAGVVSVAETFLAAGIPTVVIKHTPIHQHLIPSCLSSPVARDLVDAVAACTSKAADVLSSDGALILASRQCPELRLISFDDAFCAGDGPCPPVVGNVVVYRDAHHMTATYSATLAPALSRRLRAALPGIL